MAEQTRAVRLTRLKDLFHSRKAGYTTQQLAELLGAHVRTVQRDLLALQSDLNLPLMHEHGRYYLLQPERLPALNINLQQARALLVATRLYLRYSDEGDPEASGALEALARIMPEPVRAQVEAAARSMDRRAFDPEFARVLATVTEAWARRRVLRMSYRSAGKQRLREVIVHPYFIEPSAAGFATYLIGYSETHESMRTFKVERIVSADKLPREFQLDPQFDIETLLSSAWGIIWGEGVEVVVRFPQDVAWRVRESHWHPSQQLEDLADGGVLLTMSVASMMELGRWVRGWGDKAEVLAPADLREELREESVRLARLYSEAPKQPKRAKVGRPLRRQPTSEQQATLPA